MLNTIISLDHLFSLSAYTLVLTGIICAIIRWFHMCRPCDENPEFYYPARKILTLSFLLTVFLIPVVLDPTRSSTQYLASSFLMLYMTSYIPILFHRYYSPHLKANLKRNHLVPGLIFLLLVSLSIGSIFYPEFPSFIPHVTAILTIIGDVFFFILGYSFLRMLNEYNNNEYATQEDFQLQYARIIAWVSFVVLLLCWIPFIFHNMVIVSLSFLIAAIIQVVFLIVFLHPHFTLPIEDEEDTSQFSLSSKEKELQLQTEILAVLKDKELFLDSHITLESLHPHLSCGRTYAAKACKDLGGFYNVVNSLRLEYAKNYQKEHPEANQDEIAQESGFTCRQTMAHAKNKLNQK